MSEIEIKVPNIGDFKDVEVIEVLVSEGQTLKKNDPLITIESDKSSVEIPSNFDGKIKTLKTKVGDKVSEGDLILILENINEVQKKVEKKPEIKKEIKKRKEAIKLYESNNREDLSKIEQAELLILQSYIPEQMTEEKLKVEMIKIKDELLKENKLNIGELIKTTIKKFSSSADNSMISKIAKGLVNL